MHKTDDLTWTQRVVAASGYLFVLCLAPILLSRSNHFLLFHGKQGLLLFVIWFFWWVIGWPISVIPYLGTYLVWIGNAVCAIAAIVGIWHAARGREWPIPVIGEYARKIVF